MSNSPTQRTAAFPLRLNSLSKFNANRRRAQYVPAPASGEAEGHALFLRARSSRRCIHQTTPLRSRGAFLRLGFALGFAHPDEGWRSAEITLRCSVHRRGVPFGTPGADEAPCVSRRRSPLGAPPWRFWAGRRAFPSPDLRPDRLQRAPRTRVVVPAGRGAEPPGANGCESPPRDATPRSAFRIASRSAPQKRGCGICIMGAIRSQAQIVKKDCFDTNAEKSL